MNEINWTLFSKKLDRLSLNYTINNNGIPLTINGAKIELKEKVYWIYLPVVLEIIALSAIPFFLNMLSESNVNSIRIPNFIIFLMYIFPVIWLFSGIKIIYKKSKGNSSSKTFQKNLVTISSKKDKINLKNSDFNFLTKITNNGQGMFLGELFIQLQNNQLIPILVLFDKSERHVQDDIKYFVNVLNMIL